MTENSDSAVPSVHDYQTDIDIADAPYEKTNGRLVMVSLACTVLAITAVVLGFVISSPAIVGTGVVMALISGAVFINSNRRDLRISERNRTLLTERVDLVRPIVRREFGVAIPDDFRPEWIGKPAFISVIPTGTSSVVLSAGMKGDPTTVLIRFYPMG